MKTALDYTLHLLADDDVIASESFAAITEEHIQISIKIREKVVDVLSEYSFPCDNQLICSKEVDEGAECIEVEGFILPDDDYEPDEKKNDRRSRFPSTRLQNNGS